MHSLLSSVPATAALQGIPVRSGGKLARILRTRRTRSCFRDAPSTHDAMPHAMDRLRSLRPTSVSKECETAEGGSGDDDPTLYNGSLPSVKDILLLTSSWWNHRYERLQKEDQGRPSQVGEPSAPEPLYNRNTKEDHRRAGNHRPRTPLSDRMHSRGLHPHTRRVRESYAGCSSPASAISFVTLS